MLIDLAVPVFLAGTVVAWAADPVKIRLSYVAPISNWPQMVQEKKDLARNFGRSAPRV